MSWDGEVSRLPAQLEGVGTDRILIDDGLSRNGTYVNGERSWVGTGFATGTWC